MTPRSIRSCQACNRLVSVSGLERSDCSLVAVSVGTWVYGPLPIPPSTSNPHLFPHNVVFQTADWVNSEIPEDAQGYNVVVA